MQSPINGFTLDLDGTVYLGEAALPGAVEGIAQLRAMGKRVLFASNKPNADKTCPMRGGAIPDAGGTIAALEHMTGRKVELLAGKPSTFIAKVALQSLGLPAQEVMMVGDRLETDIFMGQQASMQTAMTLIGVSKRDEVTKMTSPPNFMINNLGELPSILAAVPHQSWK